NGLLDLHCPHRRADLSYGILEDDGLRCNYHGWLYNEQGKCLQQPFEETARPDAHYKDRIHIKAYPVEPKGGLLWAYLGTLPAPRRPLPLIRPACDRIASSRASTSSGGCPSTTARRSASAGSTTACGGKGSHSGRNGYRTGTRRSRTRRRVAG